MSPASARQAGEVVGRARWRFALGGTHRESRRSLRRCERVLAARSRIRPLAMRYHCGSSSRSRLLTVEIGRCRGGVEHLAVLLDPCRVGTCHGGFEEHLGGQRQHDVGRDAVCCASARMMRSAPLAAADTTDDGSQVSERPGDDRRDHFDLRCWGSAAPIDPRRRSGCRHGRAAPLHPIAPAWRSRPGRSDAQLGARHPSSYLNEIRSFVRNVAPPSSSRSRSCWTTSATRSCGSSHAPC